MWFDEIVKLIERISMMQNLHCIDVENKRYRDAKFVVDVEYCETSNDVVSRHVNKHVSIFDFRFLFNFYITHHFQFFINIMNQIEFFVDDCTNCYNARVANATLQNDDRRDVNFEISRIEKKTTTIQISIHCMSKFQLNAFYKISLLRSIINLRKKKNVLKTRKIDRELIYYRQLTSIIYYMQHEILFSLFFFSRNVKRASKWIAARMKRAIKQKLKIEQSNQKNEIDWIKKTFEKLNDDKFVRIFQFNTFSFSQSIESISISNFESISINKNVRWKKERRKIRRRDERNLNLNWMKIKTSNESFSVYTFSKFR